MLCILLMLVFFSMCVRKGGRKKRKIYIVEKEGVYKAFSSPFTETGRQRERETDLNVGVNIPIKDANLAHTRSLAGEGAGKKAKFFSSYYFFFARKRDFLKERFSIN